MQMEFFSLTYTKPWIRTKSKQRKKKKNPHWFGLGRSLSRWSTCKDLIWSPEPTFQKAWCGGIHLQYQYRRSRNKADPQGSVTSHSSLLGEFQAIERHSLKKDKVNHSWGMTHKLSSGLYYTEAHTHEHSYMCILAHKCTCTHLYEYTSTPLHTYNSTCTYIKQTGLS